VTDAVRVAVAPVVGARVVGTRVAGVKVPSLDHTAVERELPAVSAALAFARSQSLSHSLLLGVIVAVGMPGPTLAMYNQGLARRVAAPAEVTAVAVVRKVVDEQLAEKRFVAGVEDLEDFDC